ncbi:glutamate racemase, partial [Enterococcus lactis]|nr:glutamate racemase [Enterococcus lactis]
TTGSAKLFQEIAEDWLGIGHLNVDHIELGGK